MVEPTLWSARARSAAAGSCPWMGTTISRFVSVVAKCLGRSVLLIWRRVAAEAMRVRRMRRESGDEVIEFYREIGARRGWSVLTGRKYGGVRDLDMCGGEYSYQVSYVPISMLVRVVVRTTWTMDKWSPEYCRPQEIAPAFSVASPHQRISGNTIRAHNSSTMSHRSNPTP